MRLKRLEIIGFKSFADKTKIDFHAGITAIVGPNGCGKSNIADAFRWVLGEQSARSMRGSKMPDVIFAGTSHRKALNYAEVSITLTEVQGELPIEYDEVTVARRLHRNGESEYFINRHPVRLKDVQALFLDSGMGKDAYSIFEQGKIDQVINLPPLERRYIFEEAAGILRFLQRKKEALRKLEQTELNVARVKDIHLEVEKQIIVLEAQAERAREFRANRERLDGLEKGLLVARWDALESKIADAAAKGHAQDGHIKAASAQIDSFQSQIAIAKQELIDAEKALRLRAEEVYSVKSSKEIKSREKQTNQERLKELIAKEKRWEDEIASLAERSKERAEERKKLQKLESTAVKGLQDQETQVKRKREAVAVLEESLAKARRTQQTHQQEFFKCSRAESQSESEIRQAKVRLESIHERQGRMRDRKDKLAGAVKEAQVLAMEQKKRSEEAVGAIEEQKRRFSSMDKDIADIAAELDIAEENLERLQDELGEHRARNKALQRLKDDMEGFSAGSKQLLQESANKNSPLFEKIVGLFEYLVPEKGAEAPLAAVLKPYSQTLVVKTEADLSFVLSFVKKNKIKDVSFICLDIVKKIKAKKEGKVSVSLSPLATEVADNDLVRHFLHGAYTSKDPIDTLDAVNDCGGLDIWLGDGIFIDRRSVVFYSAQGENNIFLREAELKDLEKKIHEGEAEKQKLETIIRAIQQKRSQLQQERSELDKAIRKSEMQLVEMNFALQRTVADIERMKHEGSQLALEWESVEKALKELQRQLVEMEEKHHAVKAAALKAQKEADKVNAELELLVAEAKGRGKELGDEESTLHRLVEEQRKLSHALHVLEIKDAEGGQQSRRLEEEIELGQSQQAQIKLRGSEVDKVLKEVEGALVNAVSACSELEHQVDVRRKALEHHESKLNEKRNMLKKHEGERHQVSLLTAQFDSTRQVLEKELLERHKLSVEDARKQHGVTQPMEAVERQIKQLKQAVDGAGDINMTSIEECEKHKTRYQFLNQQIDDLAVSREELVSIIADLDGESRKIFHETFQQIRANFRKNFEVLFNGGEADLQFTESADILEAGIEIIARPPGKQMRSINLLSGGEKCLTAMALLFAVFEVKSSPFCILDEIDAPLDDSNVERFVNIVRRYCETCQFIIITHNKQTMAIADIICGVSMEERGVSKLISLEFSKNATVEMAML